jgi:hypothetical protein
MHETNHAMKDAKLFGQNVHYSEQQRMRLKIMSITGAD